MTTTPSPNEALREALEKIMPIRVHNGPDYAEVHFADGLTHSTQAETMNPDDWTAINDAFDALSPSPASSRCEYDDSDGSYSVDVEGGWNVTILPTGKIYVYHDEMKRSGSIMSETIADQTAVLGFDTESDASINLQGEVDDLNGRYDPKDGGVIVRTLERVIDQIKAVRGLSPLSGEPVPNTGNIMVAGQEYVPIEAYREAMSGWKAANQRSGEPASVAGHWHGKEADDFLARQRALSKPTPVEAERRGISKCNHCGKTYPSAPLGYYHKCGECSGVCHPVTPVEGERQ